MKRIDAIVELTKGYHTVIDIGCDHGFVLKKALDKNYIIRGIAVDNKVGPLNAAKKNLSNYNVSFFLSNGFNQVSEKFDLAVITGMGYDLMTKIINQNPNKDTVYILGVNKDVDLLRKFLFNNGFNIIDEKIIFEGKYYPLIKTQKGVVNFIEDDFLIGPILKDNFDSLGYYQHLLTRYQELLDLVSHSKLPKVQKNVHVLTDIIEKLRKEQ